MIERDLIDAGDRDVGVRVGREEHFARLRMNARGLTEQLEARHPRHPLVHEEEGNGRVARREFPSGVESLGGRARLHHAVVGAEMLPQIALDRAEDGGIVVDDEDDRPHDGLVPCFR